MDKNLELKIIDFIDSMGADFKQNVDKKITEMYGKGEISGVVFISTINQEGFPSTKVVELRKHDGISTFYFSACINANASKNILKNPNVGLFFTNVGCMRNLTLRGAAEILKDTESKKFIWKESDKEIFPNGLETPNYVVIKVSVKSGKFCDNRENTDFVL